MVVCSGDWKQDLEEDAEASAWVLRI